MYDVLIIGCGVVGASIAYRLSRHKLSIAVLEKENDVSNATTKANSGILHAGYDPEPGTQMAKLNVEGVKLAKDIAIALDVPYVQNGSLVLAFDEADKETIKKLYEKGIKNGVSDIQILTAQEVQEMEPKLSKDVKGALYAPTAAIVSPWEFTLAMAETAVKNGTELFLSSEVTNIEKVTDGFCITAGDRQFKCRYVINAAGVYGDVVHNMVAQPDFSITPVRGQYHLLDKAEGIQVKKTIFQCPGKEGKGVLVSPTVHGNLLVGPDAEEINDADDVASTIDGLKFIQTKSVKSVPGIDFSKSIRQFAGIRAVSDKKDFIISEAKDAKGFFDVAGIKSPGLSAAPAIACLVQDMLQNSGLEMDAKKEFNNTRKCVRPNKMSIEERKELIKKNPAYGRIVCRCEGISEGEILDTLKTAIPPRTLDGVKRRVSAGFGRCQGGFCGPRILEILAREWKMDPTEVLQDKEGSYILTQETKCGGSAHV